MAHLQWTIGDVTVTRVEETLVTIPPEPLLPVGRMTAALARMADDSVDTDARVAAMADFLGSAAAGISLLHRAALEPDLVGRMAPRALRALRRRLPEQ